MEDTDLDTGNPGQSESWEDALEVAVTETIEAPPAEAVEKRRGNPYKDESGRFTSADRAKAEEAPLVEEVPPAEIKPVWKPSSWKAEELNGWETLPEHARAAVERREREITQGLESSARERQYARQLQEVAAPYMQTLQSIGVSPADAYREALQAVSLLSSPDPNVRAATLLKMAQRWNVQIGQSDPQQQFQADPAMAATHQELAQLRNQMAQLRQEQAQREQQREEAALMQTIQSFAKDKPHFEQLRPLMADLMARDQSGAMTLQEAYDKALDQARSVFAAQEAARQEEAAKRAAEARKAAAVNVSGKPAPAMSAPKAKTWEEGLANRFADLHA